MSGTRAAHGEARVRVERGIYRQPNGKYAVCSCLTASRDSARSATTSTPRGRSGERSSTRRERKVLGREEIGRLLDACLPAYRALIATALYTGLRMSELLGLIWDDVDLAGGTVHVRAQLSRAHAGTPARRVAPKTPSSVREIPLAP